MESEAALLQEQLSAARRERDASACKSDDLQRELSAASDVIQELRAKVDAADAEAKRLSQQLLDQAAASADASRAAAAVQAHLQAELQSSQHMLAGCQQSLLFATSELERARGVAAAALSAAAAESRELRDRMRSLEARLTEAEHQKSLLEKAEQQHRVEAQIRAQDRKESPPLPQRAGHAVVAVQVGTPEHHHERRHSAHAASDVELPRKRHSSSSPPKPAVSLDQPLTLPLAALVSSAHLPAREPGLMRSRSSGSKESKQMQEVFPKPAPQYKNLDKFKMKMEQIEKITSSKTRKFYLQQNDLIDDIEERSQTHENLESDAPKGPQIDPYEAKTLLILRVSLAFNVALTVLKVVISIQTGSLSVLASLMDSIMDIMSGIILMVCSKIAASRDPHLYPGGKSRAEPIGIVVFSVVMGMVSLNVILESIKTLSANKAESINLGLFDILGLVAVIVTKGVLHLWSRGTPSNAAQVQSEEHRTDMGGNALSFVAVLMAFYIPDKKAWWVDATVAMLYSLFTIYTWGRTGLAHARTLVGRTADPQFIQQLTSIVYHHEPDKSIKVDTVRAYHYGANFLVEVEIILPENMTVKESHDLSESLLHKLERLPEVDRAFVHIDYEWDHDPHADHKEV